MGGPGQFYDPKVSRSGSSADNIFQREEDEAQKKITEYQRNVFVSFDMKDAGKVRLLINQAKDERFPFSFRDHSVKEPFESEWKRQVRDKISQTSVVMIAIGKDTHGSKAVDWEIREAHRQGKKVVGVRLHKKEKHIIPAAIKEHKDHVINWNAEQIRSELE